MRTGRTVEKEDLPDPEVERLIAITQVCQTFDSLPRAGGVLDQDAYTIIAMNMVMEAQEERRKLDESKRKNAPEHS